MRIYFYGSRALVRALVVGREVWCVETGEGWQLGTRSLRSARRVARAILAEPERKTFFFVGT